MKLLPWDYELKHKWRLLLYFIYLFSNSLTCFQVWQNAFFEGRLWIHAASKVPDEATIKAMEGFYREIYAVNGIYDLKFPEHYPVSRLLGIDISSYDIPFKYT